MAHAATAAVLQLLILALASSSSSSSTAAFNITRILGNFSDFSTFNDLLSRTKLADEINRRQTITVLALDNGAAGAVSSLPSDVQRSVLAVHVVLDYYDVEKLGAMRNRSAVLTTLFQSTGQAGGNRMGFINCTKRADNAVVFGSAEPGAPLTSELVKPVASRPYNISVLQVSSAIVPPGIGSTNSSEARAPPPAAMAPSPSSKTRKAAPVPAPAPSVDSSIAAAPADPPAADGPSTEADGPAADSPGAADGPTEADAPARSSDDVSAAVVLAGAGFRVMLLLATIISL